MTVELVTAIAAGIVTIIAAVGAMFVAINNGKFIRRDAKAKDIKLQDIHFLVNSRLDKALEEIKLLRTYLAKEKA